MYKEIYQKAKEYVKEQCAYGVDHYDVKDAYVEGASFAADYRIDSSWHDAEEKPLRYDDILAIDDDKCVIGLFTAFQIQKMYKDWDSFVENTCLSRWAYINSFMPTE